MKSPKQSKEEKALRSNFIRTVNAVKMSWSFKQLKTFRDLYTLVNESLEGKSNLDVALTYQDIKDWCEKFKQDIDAAVAILGCEAPQDISRKDLEPTYQRIVWEKDKYKLLPEKSLTTLQLEASLEKDYGLHRSSKEKAFLFWFQKKGTKELWDKIVVEKLRGLLLIAATGTGKTFIAGALLRRLLDIKFHEGKTLTPWPYVYVTRASVVEQTKRVFEKFFSIDLINEVLVTNIDQLRSTFGQRFVREDLIVESGEEHIKWKWRPCVFPVVILWDECQCLKNEDSQQSRIAQAYNDLDTEHTHQVFISATPFSRVSEAKCFCVSTHVDYRFGTGKAPLTNEHWSSFAREMADPAEPNEHSPAAINRLMDYMDKYVVRIKGVKPQFKAINRVQMIQFESKEEREFYEKAFERYLEEKAKLEADDTISLAQSKWLILVQMMKFLEAAEICRARHIARAMWEAVTKHNQAAVSAVKHKKTIIEIVKILVYDYNVPREKISLIWGGGPKQATEKQKKKEKLTHGKLSELMAEEELTIDDVNLEDTEDYEKEQLDPLLKLGTQSKKERQREIDKFQRGDSLYCIYTFRAGGVGLSLHHTDEFTKEKVRHKESGYAFEEDIPLIPTRQRVNFVAPTWSAFDLVQGLGRCPRLTSLSDTSQILLFYTGTIEEKVAYIVSMKLRCLTKVVRQKESWEDVIVGHYTDEEVERKHLREPQKEIEVENGDDSRDGLYVDNEEDEEES